MSDKLGSPGFFANLISALRRSRKLMEWGLPEETAPTVETPSSPPGFNMSADARKKRDEEYRKKGWIK